MSVNEIIKKMTNCINGDCHECEYGEMPDYGCEDKILEAAISELNVVKDIVHCKDCIHWGCGNDYETEHVKECRYAHWMVGENGFCVYGETNGNV